MEFTLRRAVSGDRPRISALFAELLQAVYGASDTKRYSGSDTDYYFSGGRDWICLAETADETAGFLSMEVHDDTGGYIYLDDFCVTARYRGMGAGKLLIAAAESYARSLNIGMIALHVEKSNSLARSFYERRGFTIYRDEGTRLCLVKDVEGEK